MEVQKCGLLISFCLYLYCDLVDAILSLNMRTKTSASCSSHFNFGVVACRFILHKIAGDHTFLGNHNHLPEGLPEGSFCGVGTWLPKRPTEPNMSCLALGLREFAAFVLWIRKILRIKIV